MMVTFAPPTTAPLGSVTAPAIAPDCAPWGRAAPASKSSDSNKITDRARILFISNPPPKNRKVLGLKEIPAKMQGPSKLLTCYWQVNEFRDRKAVRAQLCLFVL